MAGCHPKPGFRSLPSLFHGAALPYDGGTTCDRIFDREFALSFDFLAPLLRRWARQEGRARSGGATGTQQGRSRDSPGRSSAKSNGQLTFCPVGSTHRMFDCLAPTFECTRLPSSPFRQRTPCEVVNWSCMPSAPSLQICLFDSSKSDPDSIVF